MRFSYQLLPEQPLDEVLEVIELIDELDFWACYSADEAYHKDMWSIFAAAAGRTTRLRMGREVTLRGSVFRRELGRRSNSGLPTLRGAT
jgi:5,10-methylenetetrahydromethanopterin reductase